MAASPFSSFSAQGLDKQPQDKAPSTLGNSPLKPSSVETAPSAHNNAMKTDVYRSYSLMDVAFWDFGKPGNGSTFMSRWFGAAAPAKPTMDNAAAAGTLDSCARELTTPAPAAGGRGNNQTWSSWIFGK